MLSRQNKTLLFISFLCLSFLMTFGCQKKQKETARKPQEAVKMLSKVGFEEALRAHRGHVLVVNFFTTWCEPCRKELPHFIELSESLKSKGVDFVGVSLDATNKKVLKAFLAKVKIPYPVYLADSTLKNSLKIQAVPTTYLYDREGKRVGVLQGGVSKEFLLEKIQAIL